MTHLNPVRHYLNLTVRGGVFVRKIVIKDGKAVGMEAERGGKVFHVEADRVVLSAGAISSPHLLMLSGIGQEDQLQQFGIPTVRHLPGIGQNLWNHLSAQMTFKVKDGISLAAHADAVHFCLHYTAQGSSAINDMVLRTSPVVDERQERVPGVRARYLSGDVPPEQVARITLTPFGNETYMVDAWNPTREKHRAAVNDWIRESGAFDGVADFDLALRDPEHPIQMLPIYDCGDGLHPSDLGYCKLGDAIDLALFD